MVFTKMIFCLVEGRNKTINLPHQSQNVTFYMFLTDYQSDNQTYFTHISHACFEDIIVVSLI